jgi:hypothetical protein
MRDCKSRPMYAVAETVSISEAEPASPWVASGWHLRFAVRAVGGAGRHASGCGGGRRTQPATGLAAIRSPPPLTSPLQAELDVLRTRVAART